MLDSVKGRTYSWVLAVEPEEVWSRSRLFEKPGHAEIRSPARYALERQALILVGGAGRMWSEDPRIQHRWVDLALQMRIELISNIGRQNWPLRSGQESQGQTKRKDICPTKYNSRRHHHGVQVGRLAQHCLCK